MKKEKFYVGDTVQINRTTNIFEMGNYLWSTKLFKASRVTENKPVTYSHRGIKDDEGLGGFYDYELQTLKSSGMYYIEKLLKIRTYRGKRQLFLRWLGYNSDFDFGYLLKTTQYLTINDFYVTFISNVSDPFFNHLNKTSGF